MLLNRLQFSTAVTAARLDKLEHLRNMTCAMGSKNLDRWSAEDWRRTAETVAKMRTNGWDVISHCPKCNLTMRVDLALIERVSGGGTVLWNRQSKCRRIGCTGMVEFQGRPPRLHRHIPLRAEWPC